jgi:hypothetical protein
MGLPFEVGAKETPPNLVGLPQLHRKTNFHNPTNYWLNICFPTKYPVLKPNPQCGDIKREGFEEMIRSGG